MSDNSDRCLHIDATIPKCAVNGKLTSDHAFDLIHMNEMKNANAYPKSTSSLHWRPQGGGGTGAMAPPLAHEGGAILSFGPTFDVKGKI